jgi:DNA-3-methyladenine glycosylase
LRSPRSSATTRALPTELFARSVHEVAPRLIGVTLLVEGVGGRIVEVEAYDHEDPASHGYRGRTPRNASMFGPPGHAYVYFTYGMHYCMNVVCGEADIAEAVLLRGAQPVDGIESMKKRRPKAKREFDLMNGPGKLCAALDIDRALDGTRLDGKQLWLAPHDAAISDEDIAVSPRVGVEGAGEAAHWPLRFYLRGSRHVSPHRHV